MCPHYPDRDRLQNVLDNAWDRHAYDIPADGSIITDFVDPQPYFALLADGYTVTFDARENRENWVAGIETSDLRFAARRNNVVLLDFGQWVQLPVVTPVPASQVPTWQLEMQTIADAASKEIAHQTGFKHTSHLCMNYRKAFGITVGNAIEQYRNRRPA